MLSYKLVIGRVALLAAIAGAAAIYIGNEQEKVKAIEKRRIESPFFMEYSRDYVIARVPEGVYERYEHKGHDGLEECVQLAETFGQVYMDGADGHCDEWADTIIHRYGNTSYFTMCEADTGPILACNNELFEKFKANNSTDKIRRLWNEHRHSCDAKCRLPIIMDDL